jgi:ketosteroid isomerase-like protein
MVDYVNQKQIVMDSPNQQMTLELSRICRQWDQAIVANDVSAIGKFMAEDWVILGTEGGMTSKPNFLKLIESGDLQHNAMEFKDIRVVVYGNSAVVTSKGTSSGTYKGQPFSYYEWSTNVFINNKGEWSCVYTMLTPAEK